MKNELHSDAAVIEISKVSTSFGDHVVHDELDLEVRSGEIFALIGGSGSGSGKSTLLREMILLQRPDSGSIRVLGTDLQKLGSEEIIALRQRWGVMFQHGGLFGALSVKENVGLTECHEGWTVLLRPLVSGRQGFSYTAQRSKKKLVAATKPSTLPQSKRCP